MTKQGRRKNRNSCRLVGRMLSVKRNIGERTKQTEISKGKSKRSKQASSPSQREAECPPPARGAELMGVLI